MIETNTYKLRLAIALAVKQKPRAKEAEVVKLILDTEMESFMNWATERPKKRRTRSKTMPRARRWEKSL